DAWIKKENDGWARDQEGRQKRLAALAKSLEEQKDRAPRQWYVNGQGQTFVVVPGLVEFLMGSPPGEKDRIGNETQHRRRIGRSFAIASKAVTLEEYRRLTKDPYKIAKKWTYDPSLPVVGVNWYMAAGYCNLLSKSEGIPEEQWCYEIKGPQDIKL